MKYRTGSYVIFEGDKYLIIDSKREKGINLYRLMGYSFEYIPEKQLLPA